MALRRRRWCVTLVMSIAALFLQGQGAEGACAELTSCDSCRNTTLCHWCKDQKCHAVGSIYGCTSGTQCYDNDQCQRKVPEFRGYASPPIGVILGVFLVGGTALVCGVAAISVAREFARESAASRESAAIARLDARPIVRSSRAGSPGDVEYLMLSGDDRNPLAADDLSGEEGGRDRHTTKERRPKTAARHGGAMGARARRGRHRLPGAASRSPGPSPLAAKIQRYTQIICGTGMAATLLMCAIVVVFAPHAPGVNVCNTEFDWGSIVNSIKKASLEADFQLLVTIYNPNVMDVKIETGTAVLYHKHTEVGTMAFEPAVLGGGYVTDLLLTIEFNTEAWEEARIGLEYETKKLAFLMDATVSASVMWHGFKTYPFSFSIHNYYIKVDDTTEYDRSLCNCQHMMMGKRLPLQQYQTGREQSSDPAFGALSVGAEGVLVPGMGGHEALPENKRLALE